MRYLGHSGSAESYADIVALEVGTSRRAPRIGGSLVTTVDSPVLTPRARTVLKRWAFWVVVGLVALAMGVAALATAGRVAAGGYLDPTNPAPAGAMALAEVLRQQGVDVVITSSIEETRAAVTSPDTTTLFVNDVDQYLTAGRWGTVSRLADRIIVADPSFLALRAIAPELAQAGSVDATLAADCDLPVVIRAETVSGPGSGFRVIDAEASATACLGSGDDVFSLVQVAHATDTLTVLGATGALTNEFIVDHGNAAFALGLLGQTETLVWYEPSFADLPASDEPPTFADLSPDWVIPVLGLLIVATITAAIWRGRRFGPLVIENLPVTVRASETMLGRARLYEHSSARLRALDALRIGSVQRLAATCGLPRLATVDEVVSTVAALIGAQVADIRRLLVDDIPQTDRDLIALSDALLTLERDVTRASRP